MSASRRKPFKAHPCGDSSHDIFKGKPALEQYVRRVCRLAKDTTLSLDSATGYTVITTRHCPGAVSEDEVARNNTYYKNCWLTECGKMTMAELAEKKDQAMKKRLPDGAQKYYGDEKKLRKIAVTEEWAYLGREEADDAAESTSRKSGVKVVDLPDGLQ